MNKKEQKEREEKFLKILRKDHFWVLRYLEEEWGVTSEFDGPPVEMWAKDWLNDSDDRYATRWVEYKHPDIKRFLRIAICVSSEFEIFETEREAWAAYADNLREQIKEAETHIENLKKSLEEASTHCA